VQIDSKSLKTIPQVLGISASKKIGLILLTEFVLLELCKLNFSFENMFILMAIAIIVGLFLWFSSPDKTRYYTSFWVESVPIIWIGFYVLF
jgi:hypothetical protein